MSHTYSPVNVITAWSLTVADLLAETDRRVGLPGREAAAIILIDARPGCNVNRLRQRLGLTHSGTVRLLDRLADRDLIQRCSHGREVALVLTTTGQDALHRLRDAHEQAVAGLLEPLSATDQQQLTALMGAVLRAHNRNRIEADSTCRLCLWNECAIDCPVDESVTGSQAGVDRP
jgi:DNA-binding MarR family transcriptional regulator